MVNRVLGEKLALSVPTAIPFEEQIVVEKPPVDLLYINLYTLLRNYHGALEDPDAVDRRSIVNGLVEEINMLLALVPENIETTLYCPDLSTLKARFPHAALQVAHTPKQIAYQRLESWCIERLVDEGKVPILSIDHALPERLGRAWILTHHAVDLLHNRYRFSDTQLLESHTGRLKAPSDWTTKLSSSDAVRSLPFNALTLQVFGDKGTLFRGMRPSIKKVLLELAKLQGWSPITTRNKILSDLTYVTDESLRDLFEELISTKI